MLTVTSECVLILLKSTAALVQISSLFWSFSLRVCYTGTDQWHSVTSEGCWLCSPLLLLSSVIQSAQLKSVPVSLVYLLLNISASIVFLCLSTHFNVWNWWVHEDILFQTFQQPYCKQVQFLCPETLRCYIWTWQTLGFKGSFKLYLKAVTLLWARVGEAFAVRWVMTCSELWPEML